MHAVGVGCWFDLLFALGCCWLFGFDCLRIGFAYLVIVGCLLVACVLFAFVLSDLLGLFCWMMGSFGLRLGDRLWVSVLLLVIRFHFI